MADNNVGAFEKTSNSESKGDSSLFKSSGMGGMSFSDVKSLNDRTSSSSVSSDFPSTASLLGQLEDDPSGAFNGDVSNLDENDVPGQTNNPHIPKPDPSKEGAGSKPDRNSTTDRSQPPPEDTSDDPPPPEEEPKTQNPNAPTPNPSADATPPAGSGSGNDSTSGTRNGSNSTEQSTSSDHNNAAQQQQQQQQQQSNASKGAKQE